MRFEVEKIRCRKEGFAAGRADAIAEGKADAKAEIVLGMLEDN